MFTCDIRECSLRHFPLSPLAYTISKSMNDANEHLFHRVTWQHGFTMMARRLHYQSLIQPCPCMQASVLVSAGAEGQSQQPLQYPPRTHLHLLRCRLPV